MFMSDSNLENGHLTLYDCKTYIFWEIRYEYTF